MIKIIKDEDLIDYVSNYDVSLVTANIYSSMSNGFANDVKTKYRYVYEANIKTKYADVGKLGTILECGKDNFPTFCLCYIIKYPNARPDLKKDNLEYDSLEKCLKLVNILYKGKKICLPLLGCETFDGNGDKDKVLDIINKTLTDVDADVYDYKQKTRDQRMLDEYHRGKRILKEKGYSAYTEFIRSKKKKKDKKI